MSKIFILFAAFLFQNILHAQVFNIGHTTIAFVDTSRGNRVILTEIYYPADSTGDGVPFTIASADKFPVLSFGHGFVMTWDAYENIRSAVVPEGYIIAFPKTEGSFSPSHLDFGKDLGFIITEINRLGFDNTSLFYNRVDTMNCVMGHSMGGGSAFLAAQLNPTIKALATLAPAETSPSAIQAAIQISIPSLIFAGENDCVTPPAVHQTPMYDSLLSNCKSLINVLGGSHCQMADNNTLCSLGEATCTPQPTITRAEQHTTINKLLIPWLNYYLKNDCSSALQFDSILIADTSITFLTNCIGCNPTAFTEMNESFGIGIFPNPFKNNFKVEFNNTDNSTPTFRFLNMTGQLFSINNNFNSADKNIIEFIFQENLPAGIYFLEITTDNTQIIKKIVKQ